MKKICFLLLFSAITVLRAQTLTQAFNEPAVGDVDKNYRLDTSAYTSGLPAATGSNVVWDFTRVTGTFPIIFDSIVAPASAAGYSTFPTASYAQKRGGINSFFTSVSSPQRTEWIGVYSPSLTITFTNSAIIATYPISLGYSSTDAVTGTFKYNTTNGVCNGSLTVIADGLGTLKLPGNVTFTNVLRVRSVEELTLTTGFLPVGTISQAVFNYYVPGIKFPVIAAQYQKYQLLVGTPTITAMAYGNFNYFTVAGLKENTLNQAVSVYPNPFSGRLFVKSDPAAEPQGFLLYSLQGQLLVQAATLEEQSFDPLPAGIYLLEIKTRSQSVYQKLVKE